MTPTPEQVEAVARAIVVAVVDESEHASANEEHSRPTDLRCLDDYPAVLREGWLRIAQAALAALPEEGWRPDPEQIARIIIGQDACEQLDGELDAISRLQGGPYPALSEHCRRPHEDAVKDLMREPLAKADAILALPSPPRDQQVSQPIREEKPTQSEGEGR